MQEVTPSGGSPAWSSRPHLLFLAWAFGISWPLWALAWLVARRSGVGVLLVNEELVWDALLEPRLAASALGASLLALAAVYGPLLAGLIATRADPAVSLSDLRARVTSVRVGARWYGRLALILVGVTVVPAAVMIAVTGSGSLSPSVGRLSLFFVVLLGFQLLTSGTEEVGWRGYLLHKLLPGRSLWDAGWAVGVPWAVWHLPIVIVLFSQQGMPIPVILGALVGFAAGIVAMSILQTWFYVNTGSVFLAILVHAAFNTVPMFTVLLIEAGPIGIVVPQLLLWAVVIVIVKRHEKVQAVSSGVT